MAINRFVNTEARRNALIDWLRTVKLPISILIKHGNLRSLSQNAYLYGVCYPTIIQEANLEGFRKEDVHEWFLEECFGKREFELFGRTKTEPLHRSSTLTKAEFSDFVAFIQQKAAETWGIVIPDPDND